MRGSWKRSCAARTEGAAEETADDERRPEVAGAAARADGEAGRDDLHGAEQSEQLGAPPSEREPVGTADGELRRAVAAPEDPEALAGLPEARPDEDDDGCRGDAERESAERRLAPTGHGEASRRLLNVAHRREERAGHDRHDDRENRVERQVLGNEGVGPRVREERALTEEGDERGIADHAREDGRDERVGLEVVAVQDLDGKERGAQRRPEDGGHAGRRARDEQDATLAVGDAEHLADERADGAAHLHRRTLAPAGPAGTESEDRDDGLDHRDALANDAAGRVKGFDDRVAAASEGLRSKPRRQRAGEVSAPAAGKNSRSHFGLKSRSRAKSPRGWRLPAARRGMYPVSDSSPDACCTASTPAKKSEPSRPGRRRRDERRVKEHTPQNLELDRLRRRPQQALQGDESAHRRPFARRLGRWAGHRSRAD